MSMWDFSLLLSEKLLPHSWHVNGFSPVWMRMCLLRLLFRLNCAPHMWQVNGFSPVWTTLCLFRAVPVRYDRLHTVHMNGVMPVCFLLCTVRECAYLKVSSHTEHLYFLALVWTIWWKRRVSLLLNSFPHVAQLNGLSSECTTMWHLSWTVVLQVLSQSWHFSIRFHFSWRKRWFSRDCSILNVFPHWSQANGFGCFNRWWRLRWFCSDCSFRYDLLHRGQGKGKGAFSASWRERWFSRDFFSRKLLSHWSQGKGFLWTFMCFFNSPFQWKPTLQCSQKNRFTVRDSFFLSLLPCTSPDSSSFSSLLLSVETENRGSYQN